MEPESANPKRSGVSWRLGRIFRRVLVLIGILLAPLFLLTIINSLRGVDEPAGFRPDPAMRAMIEEMTRPQTAAGPSGGKTAARDQATTGVGEAVAVNAASADGAPATAPAGAPASAEASAPALFEVIPESEMRTAEEKAEARRFNENFRLWAERLRLYEAGMRAYQQLPAEQKEPFGDYPPYTGYWSLKRELTQSHLGPEYKKKLIDAYFQLMIHYENWEAVTEHAFKDSMMRDQYHTWDDTLFYLRQMDKPVVKYLRIGVWSGVKVVDNIIHPDQQGESRERQ